MEIYEKRHIFMAAWDAVTCILATVFGAVITAIAISPSTFNTTISAPDWLYFFGVRYYNLCLLNKPAIVITNSELHIFSPYCGYNVIRWDEIAEFKDAQITKLRKCVYPVYKEASRNKNKLRRAYIDGILTDYLTMSQENLLAELNSHLK